MEWNDRAAAFVSCGPQGGVRAFEHLRQVLAEVRVADVRRAVPLSVFTDFRSAVELDPGDHQPEALDAVLDGLVGLRRGTTALRPDTDGDGRRRRDRADELDGEVEPLRRLAPDEVEAVAAEAARYGDFIGVSGRVPVTGSQGPDPG